MASDSNHPFFRPLWRRLLIVAVVLAWSAFEFSNGETIWGVMTLAIAAYGIWVFLVKFDVAAAEENAAERDRPRDPPRV